jgi:Flp pilus assembly protein TadG
VSRREREECALEVIMRLIVAGKSARRRAATAVEFAVVGLVFFTLILAAVELGRGLMADYLLTTTARQACRVGVPAGRSNANIQDQVTTSLQNAKLPPANVTILVNGQAIDASTAKSGDWITVSVTLPVSQVTWVPGTRYLSGNLGGSYTLRRE